MKKYINILAVFILVFIVSACSEDVSQRLSQSDTALGSTKVEENPSNKRTNDVSTTQQQSSKKVETTNTTEKIPVTLSHSFDGDTCEILYSLSGDLNSSSKEKVCSTNEEEQKESFKNYTELCKVYPNGVPQDHLA